MATYTALALLEVDLEKEPSVSDASRFQEILTSATQKFARVTTELVFLKPGEGVKVVPVAEADEVEREVVGDFVPLRFVRLRRAKGVILYLLGPLAENVSEISDVKLRDNCLKANIQFPSRLEITPFVFELLPTTTARILG